MGVQDGRFFVTQSSYLLMCFQLGMIGTFGHPTYFLEDSIDRIIRSSYVPNISIMELYADALERKNIDFARTHPLELRRKPKRK